MGLFSTLRRNQSRVSSSSSSSFVHVLPDSDSPSLPNQALTPTPQRSTMFRRKKQSTPASAAVSESGHLSAAPPRSAASVSSIGDDDTPLSPPPRRSALFGGSTQSLPDAAHGPRPGLHETLSTPDVKQKKGLFSWARSNKQQSTTTLKPPPVPHMPNSAPPSSRNPKLPSPDEKRGPDDFSLRAFRHVTSTSPGASPIEPPPRAPSALSSYTDLPPPRPRPRGASTASDASQRVSVAAFREMQARRSAAGSPTPSASPRVSTRRVPEFIPPIGRSELRPPVPSAYSTTSMYSASGSASGSSPNIGRQQKPQTQTRGSMFAGADESSSEEEEEEEESGEDEPTLRPGRRNTIRGKGRQSELGTKMQPPRAPALQNSGRSASAGSVSASPVRDGRKPSGGLGMSIAASRSRTTLASSSSSDSDDDAPLAQFMMPPRSRAGSAASGRFPMPPKPLVDLGGLKLPSSTSLVNTDGGQSPTTNTNPGGRIPPVPRRTMDMSELESSSSGHGLGRMPPPTRAATLGVEMGVDSAFSPPSPAVENLAASLSPAGSVSPQAPAADASPSMGANLNSSTNTTPSVPQTGASPAVSPNPSAEAPARGRARSASLGLGLAERLSQLTAGLARSPSPGPNRAVSPGPVRGMSPGPGRAVSPGPSAALVSPIPSTGLASPSPVPALDPAPSNSSIPGAGQTSSRHLRHAADHEANANPTLNLPPPRESSLAPLPNSVSARLGMASANSTTSAYSATSSFKNRTASGGQADSDSDEESEDEKEKSGSPEPPIIPVPVKERPRGPPSFAVTSRPGGHGRSTSVGTVGSGSGSIDWTGQGHGRSESQATVTVGGGAASPTPSTVRMVGAGARREKEEELPAPRPSPARRTPVRSMTAEQQRLPPAGPVSSTSSSSAQHNKIARPALPASFTHSSASTSASSAKSPVSTVSSAQFPGSSAISSAASSATASTSSGSTGASPYGGILKNSASRSPQQTKQPPRPWARDDSPSSSTGGSSSSRAPATPRDGSELGVPMQGSSLLGGGRAKHKRQSVSFGDAEAVRGLGIEKGSGGEKGKAVVSEEVEERRRRERRRSEARAAIELGNVMNGRAPVTQDDEDDTPLQAQPLFPHNTGPAGMGGMGMFPGMQGMQMPGMMPQMPQMTGSPGMMPQMPMGMQGMQGMNMQGMQGMGMGMQDQQNMMAAHQHAMLIAKQTYQWAVAQQAMAAAADEWERTGGSVAGWNPSTAGSVYGGGAESVVGFPSSASVAGFPASGRAPSMFMNQGMNMGGMGGGMGMNPMMMGSGGSVVGGMGGMGSPWGYMSSAQSMYAGSTYSPSEVGGPSPRPNFSSSRSEYGGGERSSRAFRPPPVPAMPAGMQQGQQGQGRGGPRQRTLTAPGGQSAPGGVKTKKSGPLLGHVAPPSSWKGPGKGPA